MNLVDYVIKNANQSFKDLPFNQVDSAVLSQASYLDFNVADGQTLGELAATSHQEGLYKRTWNPHGNRELVGAFHNSKRFGSIKWTEFANVTDCDEQYQFSAITYHLNDNLCFIAFRGTVASVVGWKEDLNMSFMQTIPSQRMAVAYFMAVYQQNPNCQFILGGHSKGGNLAEFVAAKVPDALKDKIKMVYNLDGPGFRNDVSSKTSAKIRKMMPKNSVIGAILDESSNYQVVKSSKVGIRQHDLFTWQVAETSFMEEPDISLISKGVSSFSNKVVYSLDDSIKKFYLDQLFSMITVNENTYWREVVTIRKGWMALHRFVRTDAQTKKRLLKITTQILSLAVDRHQSVRN